MNDEIKLSDDERVVLGALEPGWELLILIFEGKPGVAELHPAARKRAYDALRRKDLIGFDGRGKFRSIFPTDDGEKLIEQIASEAVTS